MRAIEFLAEYKNYTQAKREIIQKVTDLDTRDKEVQSLIDRIYTTLHSIKVTDRFLSTVAPVLQGEYTTKRLMLLQKR